MRKRRYGFTILDLGIRWSCVVSFTLRLLYPPGKEPLVPNEQGAGWAQESAWTLWRREKSLAPAVNLTPTIQPVACSYTDRANPAHKIITVQC
jgi:hypothetical protein